MRKEQTTAAAPGVSKSQAAFSRLKDFDPAKGTVEELIYLSARFCDALNGTPAYQELESRKSNFDQLTGPGSPFDDLRSELSKACTGENVSTDQEAAKCSAWSDPGTASAASRHLETHGLRSLDQQSISAEENIRRSDLPTAAQDRRPLLRWWAVGPKTIHDADWVRCNLHSIYAATDCAVKSGFTFCPVEFDNLLPQFRDQLWEVWRHADRDYQLGCYLLLVSQDAIDSGPERCQSLIENLCELDAQVKAVSAAAEYLVSLTTEPPELASPATKIGSESKNSTVEVTVSFVEMSCVLRVKDREAFSMTLDETVLFMPFVTLVAINTSTGLVPWQKVGDSIGETEPEWYEKQHPRAAKGFSMLNARLEKWMASPDKQKWITTKQGKNGGRRLNESIRWLPDSENDLIKSLTRKSPSISSSSVDPHNMALSTPDRDHKLPARPRCNKKRDEENES